MALNETYNKMEKNRQSLSELDQIDLKLYNEYIDVCNIFQLDLNSLKESVKPGENQEELENFYNDCLEKDELDGYIEGYRKEVWEKYSKYVIEHLNDEEGTKTATNQIVRLTTELVQTLFDKIWDQDELDLNWVEVLEEVAGTELSGFKWKSMSLNGLTTFSKWVENLKDYKGESLYLKWVTSLTNDNVENIKEFNVKSISFGEIKDENTINNLWGITDKTIYIWTKKFENGELIEPWEENKKENEETSEETEKKDDSAIKRIIDKIEANYNRVKAWFKDISRVKDLKAYLEKKDITLESLLKKIFGIE